MGTGPVPCALVSPQVCQPPFSPSTALVWLPKRGSWFQVHINFTVSGTWPLLVQWPELRCLRCTASKPQGRPHVHVALGLYRAVSCPARAAALPLTGLTVLTESFRHWQRRRRQQQGHYPPGSPVPGALGGGEALGFDKTYIGSWAVWFGSYYFMHAHRYQLSTPPTAVHAALRAPPIANSCPRRVMSTSSTQPS